MFGGADLLETHERRIHLQTSRSALFQRPVSHNNLEAACVQNSINDNFKVFRVNFGPENVEPFQFLTSNEQNITSFVNEKLPAYGSERVGITTHVKLCKPLEDHFVTVYFHSSMARVAHELDTVEYTNMINSWLSQLKVYCSGGSGWVIETLKTLEIRMAGPSKGTASSFIETPTELKKSTEVCLTSRITMSYAFFTLYLLVYSREKNYAERPSSYSPFMDELVYQISDFPMSLSRIPTFEKRYNVSISVHRHEESRFFNAFLRKSKVSTKIEPFAAGRETEKSLLPHQ